MIFAFAFCVWDMFICVMVMYEMHHNMYRLLTQLDQASFYVILKFRVLVVEGGHAKIISLGQQMS